MRIAFYAPLKAPNHPVPSGDRAIARLFHAALQRSGAARGWEVELASRFRSFDGGGDAGRQKRLRDIGRHLANRLVSAYRKRPPDRCPALWFTYHLYHKAPDWLGPAVSAGLGIPYLVAEASHAPKQARGAWRIGHEAAAEAIRHADAILALNRDDVAGVRAVASSAARVTLLPPFLGPRGGFAGDATEARAAVAGRFHVPAGEPWLLCVAMMRGGRKLASFEVLADALARPGPAAARWHLLLAGDGPARREVEEALARRLPAGRITFTGRVEGAALAALYAGADLFVWPAVGEPMGMAMLEAQGHGLPVVAARTRGVPDLVRDEETGLLVPEGDAGAFAGAVEALLREPERRRRMGRAARDRVARKHGFEAASERLGALVEVLIRRPPGSAGILPAQALGAAPRGLEARAPGDSCSRETDASDKPMGPI